MGSSRSEGWRVKPKRRRMRLIPHRGLRTSGRREEVARRASVERTDRATPRPHGLRARRRRMSRRVGPGPSLRRILRPRDLDNVHRPRRNPQVRERRLGRPGRRSLRVLVVRSRSVGLAKGWGNLACIRGGSARSARRMGTWRRGAGRVARPDGLAITISTNAGTRWRESCSGGSRRRLSGPPPWRGRGRRPTRDAETLRERASGDKVSQGAPTSPRPGWSPTT